MACESCLTSGLGLDIALQQARSEALAYAQQTQQPVAIWREGFEYRFGGYESAQGRPVIEVVSQYHRVAS